MTNVVSELADRTEISGLVSRYFSAIDDKRLDRATIDAVFAADGRVTRCLWPGEPGQAAPVRAAMTASVT
jgi:hypothetical protein